MTLCPASSVQSWLPVLATEVVPNIRTVVGGAVCLAPDSFRGDGLGVAVNSNQRRVHSSARKIANAQPDGSGRRSETVRMSLSKQITNSRKRYGIKIT